MFKFIRFTALCNRVDSNKENSLIYIYFCCSRTKFLDHWEKSKLIHKSKKCSKHCTVLWIVEKRLYPASHNKNPTLIKWFKLLCCFNLIVLPSAAPIDHIEAIAVRRCKSHLLGRKRAKHEVRLSRPTEQLIWGDTLLYCTARKGQEGGCECSSKYIFSRHPID